MSLETSSCFGCLGDWPSVQAVSDLARHCSGPDERGQGHSGAAGVTKRDENSSNLGTLKKLMVAKSGI